MARPRVVKLADPLPCCAREGWDYCGQPAYSALAEERALVTGHLWELRPYCPKHEPKDSSARARRRGH
ncbi:MAG: hypothetical protein BWY52_01790 [Chloroflexi bacterium ADurb.Bin325]|nr:MAG: hypothetical protein BWY52_01790 [Chloroflexi bacterium ADurb.Bin325]